MGRKEHLQEGLHEIKRKKRVEVKADKKKNPRLKTKRKMRRSTKIATLCLVVSLVACAYSVGLAFFRDPSRNLVNLDYGSVSSAVESGETYSPDRGYSPVDIFARLNWTFSRQKRWYGEMHGTVDTVIQQEIETYKQYDNGILVSADLTKSSLVSGASQFCYLKDEDLVMWRKPVGNASTYRGLETEWQTGEPYRIMTINGEDGFKAKNGLPAYELSVYVIEENTILEASDVNMTEDGLYKISYSLKPETWQEEENGALVTKGATAYYANQMIFTGGLPEAPVFESINVAFTFDKNWRVFKTEIVESYNAKYGPIAAGCVSTSETKYEYDTERAVSSAYEDYFKQYLGASVDVNGGGTGEKEVTALNCLAEAFGSVLTGPVILDLDLTLNGTPQKGVVNLDLGGLDLSAPDLTKVSAKARLGAIELWVQDGKAYIDYGGMKFSLKIEELVSLFGDAIAPEEGESDLLGALAGGEFSVNGSEATLSSVLPIAGVEIPVKFFFKLDENKTASLDHVETEIEIKEKLAVGAKLLFGDETLGELANEEEYVDVLPYAQSLIGLFGSDVLHLDAEYSGDGVQVKGGFDLKVKDGFALFGKLDLGLEKDGISLAKTAELLYTDGEIFVTLDGIKVKANIEETLALLSGYFELPELSLPETGTLDLAKILNEVLSEEFASRFESTKSENLLVLLVEGTELLRAFGVEFDLGTVRLSVGDDALSVDALGAKIALTAGTEFDISTDGYVDILKYASTVIELIQSDVLHADVSYKTDKLSVAGTIDFDIEQVLTKANLTLTYGEISKEVELIYKENVIYITLDGLKLSAKVDEAIALVEKFVEIPASDTDSKELINQLLSLNFGDVIKLSESDDTLTAAIDGTKLLETLGLTFDLGQATVKIGNDQIDLAVLGANVTLTSGAPFDVSTDSYVDVVKYASTVIELIQSEVLHADVSYKTENLEIAGTIDFDMKELIAKANLTLTYNGIAKEIEVIYKENTIYITLDGLKLSAKVDEAIALVGNFVEIPENDTDSKELINQLLSLNFGEVIKLSEENDTLTAAIDGTKLLEALGLKFDLGEAIVKIGNEQIDLAVLGANVTLTEGTQFDILTDGYVDILKYAETVIELIQSEVLHADVSYKTDNLEIAGTIEFNVKELVAKANLTLTYDGIEKTIELIYKDNAIYITLDGLKLSANVEQAIALVENFVEIPANDTDSKELINNLLSLNFGEVIKLSEENDTLTAAIDGTKLLEALGLTFNLGEAQVKIGASDISLEVLGANVTLTAGTQFEANTDDFIDVVKYASTVIELIQSDVLHANVSYSTDNLEIAGTIDFDVKELIAKANLELTYNGISKEIELIYKDSTIYITLDGLKLSAKVDEAIALVENFVEIPANDADSKELINNLLSLNFGEVIKLSEENDTLTAAIDGTKLFEALGLKFDLGEATVKIGNDQIDLAVLGAEVTLTSGTSFEANTENFIDVVKYASTVIELIQSEVLHANVLYKTEKLEIVGTIDFDVKNVIAKAQLKLTYNGIAKEIELVYKENIIYITLDGLKLSANVEQAIALVENFVEIPASDTDSKELINQLLSLNFGKVIKLSESEDTLTAAIDGTKLLEALGLTFDLGQATVKIGASDISLEVLGANVTLTKGAEFETNTDDFIDVVKYASTVIELIQSEVLHADVSYKTGKLEIAGMIDFDVKNVIAKANLTLTYNGIAKEIELIYKDSTIYITLDGLKLSAKVEEAIALVEKFVEIPANDTDSKELINNLLSLNFGDIIKLSESEDTLTAAIDGTKLLEALGLTFDLGEATVKIGNDQIDLAVLGAEVTLTSGKAFETNTDDFIDVVKYASTIIELIQSEVLHADVSYKTGKLEIAGTIDLDVKNVIAKANLTLTYNGISKEIELIYKDSTIYITLDGLKLSANVEQAIGLVEKFVEIPANDTDSKELINNLLSLNFSELIELSEFEDTLTAAIDGTKLLEALGLKFDLGQATVKIGNDQIDLAVLGANVTLTSGKAFEANTDNFIDVVKYASTVIELIQSEVLHADVEYKTEKLAVEGTIDFDVKNVIAKANLTLKYEGISKSIELIYKDNAIYITLDGLKLSAKVEEAIALVENFVEIPENDTDSKELINNLLSLNFGEVIKLSESNDTLTAAIDGTKLLEALGLTFDLGQAIVKIGNDQIALEVLGANVTLTKGTQFEANTDNFIDVVRYAETVIELIQSEVLHVDVSYKTDNLEIVGTLDFDIKDVIAKANLTLTYNGISKEIELIYKDDTIYITLDGLKLSANVEQAIGLVQKFVAIPANDTDSKELINNLLSLNFGEVIKLSESNDTLTAAIDGTKLLEALGLTFDLKQTTVKIGNDQIDLAVLGAEVTLTSGKAFETNTDDFIDVVKYASTVIELIQSEVLHADVAYKTDKLEIVGTLDFDIKDVIAKANLTLTYNGISKEIELIYKDSTIYITLDGLKLSANVEQAIALVQKFVAIPANDTDSKELINNLLSLNFGDIIKLSEENDTLTAAIDGTKLLKALGLTFDLGQATVKIGASDISLEVYGAEVTLTSGAPFEANTDDFVDVVKYAETVIELIQSEVLHADVSYSTDNLEIVGTIDFDIEQVLAKADLKLTYNGIAKEIELIYKDDTIYITLDGLKLSANVEQAIGLVQKFVAIPANDTDSKELINNLLSLNFGDVIKLSEENDTLTAAIDGTKLLEALGLTFDLKQATVKIGNDQIDLAVLGANVTLTSGKSFEANTDDFIDVVKYAETVIELIQSEVLHADVSYSTDNLEIVGTLDFDIKNVIAKANLTLTYNGIAKEIELIYKDNVIYITLDGLKLSANVEQAIGLVQKFVAIPANDTDSKELINNLLSLNFGEVIKLSESEDTLTAAIDGTKLLKALGLTFDLGQATVKIGASDISLEVYGAEVTLTSGAPFEANTDDFIDVVKYAETVIELIQSDVLHANVSYSTDNLEISGAIDFDVEQVLAKANLTLTYGEISKEVELIYKENVIYITLDGLKLSANVEEAIALVEKFVEIPANDTDSKELINNLLSLNFGEIIKLSEENDTLTAAIDGTKLLEALGLTFDLGEATVKIGNDQIDLAVLGAKVTLTSGKAFEANTDDFIDVVKYASTVIELIQSEALHADVAYKTEKLAIEGKIDFDVKNVIAKANLTLTYDGITKAIELIYKDNVIYITLDGLKLSAKVEEAIALVENFVAIPANDTDSKELINQLLSLNFGEIIKLSEENDTLTAAIDGTKLLEALGLTFDLGETQVKIGASEISLEVYGANVTLTKGETFETNTDDFIDVVKYAETVIELIQSDVLHADVAYNTEKLSITGTIDFDVEQVLAKANLTLTYNGISKEIELIYNDNIIYITLDGLKLSAKVDEAIALVENFVEIPANDTDSKELINNLLSLNFGEVIKLSESEDTLTAAIDGTKLLEALGLKFDLGQATVKIGNDQIDLAVFGANVTLTKGEKFEISTDGFIDLAPVLEKIGKIVQNGGLELRGILTLDTENGEIVLEIRRAAISWKDGFKLYLDATLSVAGTAHDVKLYADKTMAKIVYGNVGVEIVYEEVKGLEAKFLQVYDRIADIVNGSFKTESGALLPKASSMKELLTSLLGKVEDTTGTLGNESMQQLFNALQSSGSFLGAFDSFKESSFGSFDLSEILGSLVLSSVLNEGTATGCITAEYKGLKLGVSTAFAQLDESLPAMVQANISYSGEGISLRESTVYLCELTSFPEMPNITYLCYEDYCELLDFFGAAITTLAEKNVGLDLSGKVLSTDEKYSAVGGEKYTFDASVRFYSGTGEEGSFPITIDTTTKSISVRSDMYLKVHLTLSSEVETGLWLDLVVMDMDPNGKTDDGMLDFFVSISKYEEGNTSRSPLSFYAPASEVKTLLSAACILLGVDNSILNDYLIEKGLSIDTRSQLQSIGDSLQLASLISGLVGKNDEPAEFAEILEGAKQEENLKRNYLSKFSFAPTRNENGAINGNTLTIALNGKAIYNDANAKDIELILQKQGESFVSSRLTKVALSGVTSGSETFSFELGFSYDEIKEEEKTKIEVTHNFDGVERLITSIAKSATHTATNEEIISGEAKAHDFVLNKTFYIDGTANVSALSLVKAEIKVIAISVTIDEENKVAVNLRLAYEGKHLVTTLIKGDSTVDITIKDGMVYMKRVQTSYFDIVKVIVEIATEKQYAESEYITIYRTTTLSNFFDDILKHLGFLLNFGDSIVSAIEKSEPAQPADTTALDYGALVGQYFVGYECKHQEGGEDTWTINLNGNALTNGVLGEIGITFTADKNDIVKDLHVSTKLYSIISLTLDLNWRNPQSADDFKDNQTDRTFADELASKQDGIGEMLETHDFASERFIEYQKGVINYSYHKYNGGDESLGASDVYYRMSDRTLLNEPHVPDLEEHNDKEFYLTWDNNTFYHKGGTFPNGDQVKTATQKAHMYNVTFVTSNEQAGTLPSGYSWAQDGDNKSFTAQMKYNATVKFTANGTTQSRTVDGDMTIELPDVTQFHSGAEGEWNLNAFAVDKAEFTAFYPLTVRYYSEIGYNASPSHAAKENYDVKVEDSDYKLITPTASGYTFLGWFTKEGGNWREAKEIASSTVIDGKLMLKVEALWMKDGFFSISATETIREEKVWGIKIKKYDYAVNLSVDQEYFIGAFAKEAEFQINYKIELCLFESMFLATSKNSATYTENGCDFEKFRYVRGSVEVTLTTKSGIEVSVDDTITQPIEVKS